MLGILLIVGLAVALAGIEILVRRIAGEHPHHAATPSEAQPMVDVGRILPAADGRSYGGDYGGA